MDDTKKSVSDEQLKNAVSELISKLPDDVLNSAVGGLDVSTIKKLVAAGFLSLASLGTLFWVTNGANKEDEEDAKIRKWCKEYVPPKLDKPSAMKKPGDVKEPKNVKFDDDKIQVHEYEVEEGALKRHVPPMFS